MSHHKWSVLFNRWDEDAQQWMPIPTKRIGDDSEFAYYSTNVSGFSTFCITGSKDIPAPEFELTNLAINPVEAIAGEKVTISADVTNLSDGVKTYSATLWINQTAEKAKDFEVPAGGKVQISFTAVRNIVGEYQVRIDKLIDHFTVKEVPDTVPPEINSCYPVGVVEEANPTISAGYSDDRAGVDKATVKLLLDGEDVTSIAEVTESQIRYIPVKGFNEGEHVVKISVADKEGNENSEEWTFITKGVPVLPGAKHMARDLNGDGLYEDVNGDGKFNFSDAVALFENMDSEVVQGRAALFDFNLDGVIDVKDCLWLRDKSVPLSVLRATIQAQPEIVTLFPKELLVLSNYSVRHRGTE